MYVYIVLSGEVRPLILGIEVRHLYLA